MKIKFFLLLFLVGNHFSYSQTPNLFWGLNYGGIEGSGGARLQESDVSVNNLICNVGSFTNTVDLDPGSNSVNYTSLGSSDTYIQVLSGGGDYVWSQVISNEFSLRPIDVAFDASENVYVTFKFQGALNQNFGNASISLTANGFLEDQRDLVLIKFSNTGDYLSHIQYEDCSYDFENAEIEINGNGEPILVFNEGTDDIQVQKLNPDNLSLISDFFFGNQQNQGTSSITNFSIDADGNYLFTGLFSRQISLNPEDLLAETTGNGNNINIYYSKVSSSGQFIFGNWIGSDSNLEDGFSIIGDNAGNTYLSGQFSNTATFNYSTSTSSLTSNGLRDAFLLKLDDAGDELWLKQVGSVDEDAGYTVSTNGNSVAWVCYISDDADTNPNSGTAILPANAFTAAVILLDSEGNYNWSGVIDEGSYANNPLEVNFLNNGNLHLSGSFVGASIDIDPTQAVQNLLSQDGSFSFTTVWSFCNPVTPAISISSNLSPACPSDGAILTATFENGGNNPQLNWRINGVSSGISTVQFNTSTLQVGDIVTCELTSNAVCPSSITAESNSILISCSVSTEGVLYFSEYVEGSGNNKAIEIFNPTNEVVALEDYSISVYFNGSTTASQTYSLSGFLGSGDVIVIANNQASDAILAQADFSSGVISFNGNDAVALNFNESPIDIVGVIGINPGNSWEVFPDGTTENHTLIRNADVLSPETDWEIAKFQWTSNDVDFIENLGFPTLSGGDLPEIIISTENTEVCFGADILFSSSVTNGGNNPSYQWYINDIPNGPSLPTLGINNVIENLEVYCEVLIPEESIAVQSNVISISLLPPPNTDVIVNNNSLSIEETNAGFQWVDCDNSFAPIQNENASTFNALQSGNYAVQVISTITGCEAISECNEVIITGILDKVKNQITLYPNPVADYFNFYSNEDGLFEIFSKEGKLVDSRIMIAGSKVISTQNLAPGLYIIKFFGSTSATSLKLVKY